MARNKPIPRSQRNTFNRGQKISRNSPGAKDDVKNLSVGLMDMDSAIMYYFKDGIKLQNKDFYETKKDKSLFH